MIKKLYIDGRWMAAAEHRPLYSPFDGKHLADISYANAEETQAAIAAANEAKKIMRQMPAHQRADILRKVASLMEARAEECALTISREAAKPLKASRLEVQRTIMTYTFASEEARRIGGETLTLDAAPGGDNRLAFTIHEPLGVIGAITPFNFPMNLVAHKVGPAIAAGNAVVLKPAVQTPLSALLLAEMFEEAGLPAGALNIVTGSGSVAGDTLVTDERVNMITFTGSPAVGIAIRNKAGLKKVTLELGSNSALIIDRGTDIASMIERAVTGAFSNSGQVCISIQRIYVHEALFDTFVEQFVKATKKLTVGDPLDPQTDVSALIHAAETKRALEWVEEAQKLGAVVAYGGQLNQAGILQPTVLLHVPPDARVCVQEAFAPVVMINQVSSMEEAISSVNQSRYGLQAGIYTPDIRTALQACQSLEVGGVLINDIPTFRVDHMPYGGVKESGTGREGVKYAVQEMTEMKLVIMAN